MPLSRLRSLICPAGAALALLAVAGCADLIPAPPGVAPTPMAPTPAVPVGDESLAPAPENAPAQARPSVPTLTRDGQQVVTLDIRNLTDGVIVGLTAERDGHPPVTLLSPGAAIAAGGTYPVPAAPGQYLMRADLQAPNLFARGRQVQRTVIVPRFPPNPPPRLQVTLR